MSDVDLRAYVLIVWRWLWLIVSAALLAAVTSYFASRAMPKIYLSSLALMVGQESLSTGSGPNNANNLDLSQRAAIIYAGVARRQPVLARLAAPRPGYPSRRHTAHRDSRHRP
jgi:capsular polysaccharide biosynthesis protein